MQDDLGASLERFFISLFNIEGARSIRAPFVSRLPADFGNDFDMVSNNKRGVESDTELPDDVVFHCFAVLFHGLHKLFRSALGNRPKVRDEVFSGHANSVILYCNLIFGRRNLDTHVEIFIGLS